MNAKTFSILGAGRTGRALGRLLARHGLEPAGVTAQTLRSARQATTFIGGGVPGRSNVKAASGAALVFITTPDRVIPLLAEELAESGGKWKGRIVAHTSGALSSTVLEPLRARGAHIASLHPLASIPDPRAGLRDPAGIPFAIEGDPRAVRVLRRLVLSFGGMPVTIPQEAKALYHLIAVLMSNDLVALLAIGLQTARSLGLSERQALRLYMPLVRGTVDNVDRLGPVKALTGPVSRGDTNTLRLHAEMLRTLPAESRKLHRLLGLQSIDLAIRARTITPEMAVTLARMLKALP